MHRYDFLLDTYETERVKTLAVWSLIQEGDMNFRPEPRARTPREHMVHQCVSEETWMKNMLGIETGQATLPEREVRLEFMKRYAEASARRLVLMRAKPESWFEELARFFDVERSRAWILMRRIAHSAHHRGQLTAYLRFLGRELYSTYGPTADTGGLFLNHAPTVYRYPNLEAMLQGEEAGGMWPPLPGPGEKSPVERPD